MAIFPSSAIPSAAADYTIDYSCRFAVGDSPYMLRTPGSAGNRKTWTVSFWAKRSDLTGSTYSFLQARTGSDRLLLRLASETLALYNAGSSPADNVLVSSANYRDPTAWYHIVYAVDTTQATDTNRCKMYVNGVQVTDLATENYPSINTDWQIGNTVPHYIGCSEYNVSGTPDPSNFYDGYLAEFHYINALQLTPSSFGETNSDTNQWVPTKYTGAYGTNGFYFKFQDSASLGDDSSGNGNDFTTSGLSATDQMLDTPTNNFCTWNPLVTYVGWPDPYTMSEGNLKVVTGVDALSNIFGTMATGATGKWYAEFLVLDSQQRQGVGATSDLNATQDRANNFGNLTGSRDFGYAGQSGLFHINGGNSAYGDAFSNGDIIAIAINLDDNEVNFYRNNVAQGVKTIIASSAGYVIGVTNISSGYNMTMAANYGQDSSFAGEKTAQGNQDANAIGDFYYAPPTGFLAVCTSNLPDPEIALPTDHFNTVLYTGTDVSAGRAITGVGFQPDFVWSKSRSIVFNHLVEDSVRGSNKTIRPDENSIQDTDHIAGYLTSFDSDGYTTVAGTTNNSRYNDTSVTYVSWNWKAGGAPSVTNSAGSIESEVSANTTAGFSIVTFENNNTTGATVGHGLSQAPDMMFLKLYTAAYSWNVYSSGMDATAPEDYYMELNNTSARADSAADAWNDTPPSATVFTLGAEGSNAVGGEDVVAYCFHSVEGYSKIGSYEGNGSLDGAFIYTGFRPAFVITKSIDSTSDWQMFDEKRVGYNVDNYELEANDSAVEDTSTEFIDIVSNGFKNRDTTDPNVAETYIYLAFASSPFKTSNAR